MATRIETIDSSNSPFLAVEVVDHHSVYPVRLELLEDGLSLMLTAEQAEQLASGLIQAAAQASSK